MKQFNKTISIEIEVDTIAQLLSDNMNQEFKHKDIVVESIIGNLVSNNQMRMVGDIYNALNGHTKTINFEIGDTIDCIHEVYYNGETQPIGNCTIIEIDVYKDDQLHVQWMQSNSKPTSRWVNKSKCTKLTTESIEEQAIAVTV